jgi:DNA-binding YbaB/EbfC family protein
MNIQGMMKKAQQMQKKIGDVQTEFEAREIEGAAGGGAVKTTINGKKQLLKISIDASLIDVNEKDMLEDLIVAAVNDAGNRADTALNDEMQKVTASLGLPAGMKLPF